MREVNLTTLYLLTQQMRETYGMPHLSEILLETIVRRIQRMLGCVIPAFCDIKPTNKSNHLGLRRAVGHVRIAHDSFLHRLNAALVQTLGTLLKPRHIMLGLRTKQCPQPRATCKAECVHTKVTDGRQNNKASHLVVRKAACCSLSLQNGIASTTRPPNQTTMDVR